MRTYPTLDAARAETPAKGAITIIEIDHASDGRCYIGSRVPMATMAGYLSHPSLAEIVRVIAEHAIQETIAAAHDETCDRCGRHVDGRTTCSQQQEWASLVGSRVRVTAYYCTRCAALLGSIGQGEHTDLDARAADIPSAEPTTKTDL